MSWAGSIFCQGTQHVAYGFTVLTLRMDFCTQCFLPNLRGLAQASLAREDFVSLILVAPHLPAQAWFPDLLYLSQVLPRKICLSPKALVQPKSGVPHTNPEAGPLGARLIRLTPLPLLRSAGLSTWPFSLQRENRPLQRLQLIGRLSPLLSDSWESFLLGRSKFFWFLWLQVRGAVFMHLANRV